MNQQRRPARRRISRPPGTGPAAVPAQGGADGLSRQARALRLLHNCIGAAELGCLGYLWLCAITGRRDRWLSLSAGVLAAEGIALVAAKGCPLGIFQRRAGDDVPMFELWFGPRLAPFATPALTVAAAAGLLTVATRPAGRAAHSGAPWRWLPPASCPGTRHRRAVAGFSPPWCQA